MCVGGMRGDLRRRRAFMPGSDANDAIERRRQRGDYGGMILVDGCAADKDGGAFAAQALKAFQCRRDRIGRMTDIDHSQRRFIDDLKPTRPARALKRFGVDLRRDVARERKRHRRVAFLVHTHQWRGFAFPNELNRNTTRQPMRLDPSALRRATFADEESGALRGRLDLVARNIL